MSRPNTSPLSDFVDYGLTLFGPEIDGLVRILAQNPDVDSERVESLLWDHWEPWTHRPADMDALLKALMALNDGS